MRRMVRASRDVFHRFYGGVLRKGAATIMDKKEGVAVAGTVLLTSLTLSVHGARRSNGGVLAVVVITEAAGDFINVGTHISARLDFGRSFYAGELPRIEEVVVPKVAIF